MSCSEAYFPLSALCQSVLMPLCAAGHYGWEQNETASDIRDGKESGIAVWRMHLEDKGNFFFLFIHLYLK